MTHRPLSKIIAPLLQSDFNTVVVRLQEIFPPAVAAMQQPEVCVCVLCVCIVCVLVGDNYHDDGPLQYTQMYAHMTYMHHTPPIHSPPTITPPYTPPLQDNLPGAAAAAFLDNPPTTTSNPTLPGTRPTSLLRPRLLLCGPRGAGQGHVARAVLHALEGLPLHAIGLPSLLADAGARSAEEALVHAVSEARRSAPAVLYLPHLEVCVSWEGRSFLFVCLFVCFSQGVDVEVVWGVVLSRV